MRSLLESDQITIHTCLHETQERVLADDVLDGPASAFVIAFEEHSKERRFHAVGNIVDIEGPVLLEGLRSSASDPVAIFSLTLARLMRYGV